MNAKPPQLNGLDPKPLLRGWFHAGAAVAAVIVTVLLVWQAREDPLRLLTLLIFGLTLIVLYVVSAVYHIGRWRGRWHTFLRAFDHANIFLVIAGTYTPLCVNVLAGWVRGTVLGLVWTLAIVGAALSVFTLRLPRWLNAVLYIGMGWVALISLPQMLERLPWTAIAMLFLGGLLYTAGAVVYALKRPNPAPRYFGFHEIFHLFVIAGSAAFVLTIWLWVLPYPRA